VHQDVVRPASDDRIHSEHNRAGQLAAALESSNKPGINAEAACYPFSAYSTNAVLDNVVAGGGQQAAGNKTVDRGPT
jgi:hypothetical protein